MRKQKVQRLFRAWRWHRRRGSWTGWFPCLKMILCFYHTRLMPCLGLEFRYGNHFSLWTLKTLLYYLLVSRNEKSFTIWTLDAFYTFPSFSLEACGMFSFLWNLKLHNDWYSRGFIFSHCVGFVQPFQSSALGNWLELSLPFCFLCSFSLESLPCGCWTISTHHLIFLFLPPPPFSIFFFVCLSLLLSGTLSQFCFPHSSLHFHFFR